MDAQNLMTVASQLGQIINEIFDSERSGSDLLTGEEDSCELIQAQGPEMISALRQIAMRLDRSALIRFNPE